MSYFLQANAFLIFFYALYYLLLRRETFFKWNRGYLLVSVVFSLVIPMLKMPEFIQRNTQNITLPAPIEQIIIPTLPTEKEAKNTLPAPTRSVGRQGWGLWEWLIVGYFVVVGLLLLRFLLSVGWLFWLGRQAVWQKDGRYYIIHLEESKQSFSFFRTLFLGNMESLTTQQVSQIIHHELAHIRQKHTWDIMLLELVHICFWLNPIGVLYKKSIRKIHEYLADKEALAYQHDKTEYANLILNRAKV